MLPTTATALTSLSTGPEDQGKKCTNVYRVQPGCDWETFSFGWFTGKMCCFYWRVMRMQNHFFTWLGGKQGNI